MTPNILKIIQRLEAAVKADPVKYANIRGFLTRVPESEFYRPPCKRNGVPCDTAPTDREIEQEQFYL